MRSSSSLSGLAFIVILGVGIGIAFALGGRSPGVPSYTVGIVFFLLAALVSASLKIANQWDKAVVLRMGRFQALRGPGLFFIIPMVDTIVYWIDTRVITMSFTAE